MLNISCTAECLANETKCNNGRCLPSHQLCDGIPDCEDGEDEPFDCGTCIFICIFVYEKNVNHKHKRETLNL